MTTTRSRQPTAAPRALVIRGCCLELEYDLANGRWHARGALGEMTWQIDATATVGLVDPVGQAVGREIAGSVFVSCEPATSEPCARRLEIWRTWPDGLLVCQRFAVRTDAPDLTAELSVRAPRQYRLALRSLSPLTDADSAIPNLTLGPRASDGRLPNLTSETTAWRVFDAGWSADAPASVSAAEPGVRVTATGLAALGAPNERFQLTLGFLAAEAAVGRYRFDAFDRWHLGLGSAADFGTIDLGTSEVTSGPLWVGVGPVGDALPRFAERWRSRHPPKRRTPTTVQWIIGDGDNAEPRARPALDRLGTLGRWAGATALDAVTIGPGWQRATGDWTSDPARFPRGLAAMAEAIHSKGQHAGIAGAPFLVERSSDLFRRHPSWVVRAPTGDPIAVGVGRTDVFSLDLSQPAVEEWVRSVGRRVIDDWAFDLVIAESLSENVVSGWRRSPASSPIQGLRIGLRALKESLGDHPLVASMAPLFPCLDLADAVLTDRRPLWRADPSAPLRAFLHDTGCLTGSGPLRLDWPEQTLDEARAAASIASFAGGMVTLDGDPSALTPDRMAILRACLPPTDAGSIVPINPFDPGGPSLFECRVARDRGDYTLLLVLNPRDVPVARVIRLEALGLPPGRYHGFEFWSQRYLGVLTGRLTLDLIPAGGCAVVALRAVRDEPQVVGTSLHVSLGAMALQGASYDRMTRRLHLAIGAAGERQGTLTIALPRRWTPGPIRGTGGTMSVRQTSAQLAEIILRFKDVAELELEFWQTRNG
ncbi:MAG: alpha-galactosidase [Chloroflexota bacterium]